MNKSFLPVHKIILATIAGISFAVIVVLEPTLADINQPFGSAESNQNNNPLSSDGSNFMLDMIHRANFGSIQWNADEQNQQLDAAAAAFKAQQQKLLQSQNKQNPDTPKIKSGQNSWPSQILPSSDK
ncbi:hypothetical protein RI030_14505 [Aphanizomenon flos-aquae NRERC-008]|jgi:hypothetical protein|uniref:Uncharacterized protein n=1 Tax=Aphanizomenon flos-aquae FACHB-1249 TaxID=2692889 RepID=A0ABR8IW04_APHFL|nr:MULTISPECIES: hypothetical protein [Aphanizomenon]MBO1059042.1 hypothetical protein [Dolichospermum sp. JUN01]MBD2391668.1 hypothetical protein [Aphanizomenon flos-aquae FACHB-1171]MBD2556096.1 hypothetical protein [Aphanizomenon flos-aquae FACHB-1290]MBD2632970.1 hypothetical protein [Aphanizomenon sp. FACHB-1399]MBD2643786.1 hypothetical protein [Aphanizomenon sp. FACHB-1401]